ncbi:MAG: radical SAM protein [Oscillospiraceae bacterium]|nr:radical SAM protein [Oscillospiraceae bacterium]
METNKILNFVVKITTNCPANCKCCTNRKKEIKNKSENNKIFDLTVFEKVCINLKKMGGTYVYLSGGEPTIVSSIDDFFEIARKNGLAVRMNTNGWGITEKKFEKWLLLGLEQIVLSVYSLNEETVKYIRGNPLLLTKFLNATNVIKKFREKNNFKFVIQSVIMQNNYKEMPELLEYAIKNKADHFWPSYLEDAINLPEVRMEGKDIEIFRSEIVPKMKNVIEKYVHDIYQKEHLKMYFGKYHDSNFDNYIYNDNIEKVNCHWLGRHLTLYPNGTIYPCPGHEYFSTSGQYKIDYNSVDDFLTWDTLNKNVNSYSIHCKHCPQPLYEDEMKISNNP